MGSLEMEPKAPGELQRVHHSTQCSSYLLISQAENRFALSTGCLPPKTWNSTWPLGLDMLVKAARYARTMQILRFFLDVVDDNGTTFEQKLLGARGIDTIDPRNIETVLSTDFGGKVLEPSPIYIFQLPMDADT